MDSRLIYSAAAHLNTVVSWDNEWTHFGTGKDIYFELIKNLINNFLEGDYLNFVYKRDNSGYYKSEDIIPVIEKLLGRAEFQLWNTAMDKVIQFDEIGVLQIGRK
jgi:hypothetical protein